MLFTSIEFAIFLPLVFVLYWFVTKRNLRIQNLMLLVASYVFYGWWDWRFLSLIMFSSVVDFTVGLKLSRTGHVRRRKLLLLVSILINLGFLGFFKYFNFFAESFSQAFTLLGEPISVKRLNVILPVGISFYTFQTLSYTIDVYKRKLEPTKDIISFFAFVSFFPQLVAGPIERATNLLPQFYKPRNFDYTGAVDGMRQILWGLFKKIVIADNCAYYANYIYGHHSESNGSTLFIGTLFFAFQIYGDFSGYSDIAIGTSRLFGFKLMRNFAFPYFSRDIAEFWRRWHISLSTWFRDYVYIPLGGSRGRKWQQVRNIFIIFLVSGFWHGANWTFLAWGFVNACYFLPLMLLQLNRKNVGVIAAEGRIFPSVKEFFQITLTFLITVFAWVFFRSENMNMAFDILEKLFSVSLFQVPIYDKRFASVILFFILGLFVMIEWSGREREYAIAHIFRYNTLLRWVSYHVIILSIVASTGKAQPFIYFQF